MCDDRMKDDWPGSQVSHSSSCCSVPHGQDMFSERVGPWELLSRCEGRVALAGTVLALLQSFGLVLSLYMLVSNYMADDRADDPASHICTEAVLCLLYRYGPHYSQTGQTDTALAGQMLYSLLAISVNLLLVGGALGRRPVTFLPWLVVYGVAGVLGSLVLAFMVPLTITFRDRDLGDVEMVHVVWFILPLFLFIFYSILWSFILSVFLKFRKLQSTIYYVEG